MNQKKKIYNIFGCTWGPIQQLCKLLRSSWGNQPHQSVICQIWIYDLQHGFRSHICSSLWPCQIIDILEILAKFLRRSGYCNGIQCAFTFHSTIFLSPSLSSYIISAPIRLYCTFICADFKSHTMWINAQRVSPQTTTILLTTVGTRTWTASIPWYTCLKQIPIKILQIFCLALVIFMTER